MSTTARSSYKLGTLDVRVSVVDPARAVHSHRPRPVGAPGAIGWCLVYGAARVPRDANVAVLWWIWAGRWWLVDGGDGSSLN